MEILGELTQYQLLILALPILGAAISVVFAGFGSAIGIGYASQVATGVLAEDPDKFGSLLILVALPGTQGIYGFLAAFLILMKIGFVGGDPKEVLDTMTMTQAWMIMIAGIPTGFACWISGMWQGKVCASGISMAAKRPEAMMKAVIYGAMVETYAILGLLITILMINGIVIG